jgi:signal transduction histidine kinase
VRVQRGLRSELAVPLKVRGRVLGVISVDSRRVSHFSPEDEALLLGLAAHSSRVIEATQLGEAARRRAEERRVLLESGRVLAGTLDLREVLGRLGAMTARFCRASAAAVYLLSDDGRQLDLEAGHGATEVFRQLASVPVEGTLLGRVLHGGAEAVAVQNLAAQVSPGARQVLEAGRLASILAAPLPVKERRLGLLCVFARRPRRFGKDQRRLLAGLARSAALAIENAQIHRKVLALEQNLRQAEKCALMAELAAGLAHEVRNPLTSLRILLDSLLRGPSPGPAAAEDAAMVRRQLDRLEQIVQNYLETAKARVAALEAKPLDLNQLINESLLLLAGSANEGTRIVCSLPPDELRVRGDATQLSQAIYNLVLNALQAVGSAPAPGPHRRVEIRSGLEPGAPAKVFFEVADDGPGLAAEVRARLFQPFVTTRSQGVGLGLSIVKRVVDAHGGELEIESPRPELGRGARFRIRLPAAEG